MSDNTVGCALALSSLGVGDRYVTAFLGLSKNWAQDLAYNSWWL